MLRFVLLVDAEHVPAWQARAVDRLIETGLAEVALIVRNAAPPRAPQRRARWRKALPRGGGLWQVFERTIASKSLATRSEPLPAGVRDAARLDAAPLGPKRRDQSFAPDVLAAIADARPDVIVRFGFGILRGDILTLAPQGVWSFHHGDPSQIRGQPPGFWEIALRQPVTGVILQRLSAALDAGSILYQGWFKTIPQSYARQRDQIYFGAAGWLAQAAVVAAAGTLIEQPQEQLGPILRKPSNVEFVHFAWVTLCAIAAARWNSLFVHQHWTVGVLRKPIGEAIPLLTDSNRTRAAEAVRWMPVDRSAFVADPFPLLHGSGIRILAERLPWRTGRGELVAIDHDRAGNFSPVTAVWQPAFHCSYPYLAEEGGRWWCLPEISAAGETRRFPVDRATGGVAFDRGEAVLPVGLVDPTTIVHDGRHWLFASDAAEPNTLLLLFFADQAGGPWTPHPANPVKTDIRSARPAGRPFIVDGHWIRPAQDCSVRYGGSIRLNRIVTLTPTAFREEEWGAIPPLSGRYRHGLHTLSWTGEWTVIDAAGRTFAPQETVRVLRAKLGRGR